MKIIISILLIKKIYMLKVGRENAQAVTML